MKEYGLVLAGGGTKGGYEIGVYKSLLKNNINIKAIAGVSVGALNGAIIAQGDFEKAEELWKNINVENIINTKNLNLRNIIFNKGIDVTPLRNLLEEYIDEDKIRKSQIDFGLVTFSITDFKPLMIFIKDIPKGTLIDYLLASASLPIFKPQEIDGKLYVDGAVYDNMPVSILDAKGIKDIIQVDISGVGRIRKIDESKFNLIKIKNSRYLGGTLDFNGEISKRNLQLGFIDSEKLFNKIKTKNFYINQTSIEALTLEEYDLIIGSVSDRLVRQILFKALRRNLNEDLNSRNFILSMADIAGEVYKIDYLEKYNEGDMLSILLEEHNKIIASPLYNLNLDKIKNVINNGDIKNLDSRFLSSANAVLNIKDNKLKHYRRFLALYRPKLLVSNLLLS
jgi:NTE family protein